MFSQKGRLIRIVIFGAVTGALSGSVAVAYGNSAWSNLQYTGNVYGYSYDYQSGVDNTRFYAISGIAEVNSISVPTGYMGAAAHLYEADGSLCEVSGWAYNPAPAYVYVNYTPAGAYCGSGYYYGKGFVRSYTGSSYNTYTQYSSPQLLF